MISQSPFWTDDFTLDELLRVIQTDYDSSDSRDARLAFGLRRRARDLLLDLSEEMALHGG